MLVSGQGLHELLTDGNSRLASAVEQQTPTEEVVELLYWSVLSRAPRKPSKSLLGSFCSQVMIGLQRYRI